MDFSPSRQAKIAACEKLRDTVTGISALHKSLLDESLARSPSPRNSFIELYRMSTQAMAMKKEEMVNVLNQAQVHVGANNERGFAQLDEERVSESKRHSLSEVKTSRKKNGSRKKRKLAKDEIQEAITYKSGEI
ncbi:hypothetical protein TNIN_358411 [Trichonephila inaurata madagascariensis]|uniref:Uncharacterized protein n=1 Tax=Trichonephila inaurata madagascariensis TaxID=2747483 RepID=A0A8X6XNN7_9ARAC|nr:hypothetical protein TNIN_358411 [Trichonephila inaurata madagascariensis]